MSVLYNKKVYILLGLIVTGLVVWKFDELTQAITLWRQMNWLYVVLAIALQVLSYSAMSSIYRSILKIQGVQFSFAKMFSMTTVLIFFNRAMPSLGLSGSAFMIGKLHHEGLSRGKALIVQVLFHVSFYLAFFIMLLAGFAYLFLQYDLTQQNVVVSLIAIGVVTVLFGVIMLIVNKEERLLWWVYMIERIVSKISKRMAAFITTRKQKIHHEVREIAHSWKHFWKDFTHMSDPLFYSFVQHAIDVITIYVIFLALGHPVPLGVLTVGYVMASLFAFLSLIPNGIGVYEASMVLLLNGLNVPPAISLSGVLAFRVLFYWLPIPVGFYYYRKFRQHHQRSTAL